MIDFDYSVQANSTTNNSFRYLVNNVIKVSVTQNCQAEYQGALNSGYNTLRFQFLTNGSAVSQAYALLSQIHIYKIVPLFQWAGCGGHYYSTNETSALSPDWEYQQIVGYVFTDNTDMWHSSGTHPSETVPLYQWFGGGHHYYSTDYYSALPPYWSYQGIACYVYKQPTETTIPLHQFCNSSAGHYYNTDRYSALSPFWTYQGIACYLFE